MAVSREKGKRELLTLQLEKAKAGDLFKRRDGVLVRFKQYLPDGYHPYPVRFYAGRDYPAITEEFVGYTKSGRYVSNTSPHEYDIVSKVRVNDYNNPIDDSTQPATPAETIEIVPLNEPTINPVTAHDQADPEMLAKIEYDFKCFVTQFKDARNSINKKDWQLAQLNAIKVLAVLTYD